MRSWDDNGAHGWGNWSGVIDSNRGSDRRHAGKHSTFEPQQRIPQSRNQDGGQGGLHTDLYLAEIPSYWDEDAIFRMHADAGADVSAITGVKLLPMKASSDMCRAVIVKYASQETAAAALDLIQGRSVTIGDMSNSIIARFATKTAGGGGKGGDWSEDRGTWDNSATEFPSVTARPGLRVRNLKSGNTGTILHVGDKPGHMWVMIDGAGEWEREIANFETEDGYALREVTGVQVRVNRRVRNTKTWRTGTITWVDRENPGAVWVLFDDGEERERHISNFESEDGRPLVGFASRSMRTVNAAPGLRVWNVKNGRAGMITQILPDGMTIRIRFDDGDEREREMANFESFDGRVLTAVPGKGGGGKWGNAWEWGEHRGKGKVADLWDEWHGAGPQVWNGPETWSAAWGSGAGGARGSKSVQGSWNQYPQQPQQRAQTKPLKNPDKKLVDSAIKEVKAQLKSPNFDGKVWVRDWPGRYQAQLGQLRDFLESHPEQFTVARKGDRAYTVTIKKKGGDEAGKAGNRGVVGQGEEDASDSEEAEEQEKKVGALKWKRVVRPDENNDEVKPSEERGETQDDDEESEENFVTQKETAAHAVDAQENGEEEKHAPVAEEAEDATKEVKVPDPADPEKVDIVPNTSDAEPVDTVPSKASEKVDNAPGPDDPEKS